MGITASQFQIGKGPQLTAPRKQSKRPPLLTILLALLAVIALLRLIAAIHMAYPANTVNNCADLIRNNDYTKNIPQLTRTQQITAVQQVNELTGGQPAAMVQVADTSAQQLLDIYIYRCSMQHPTPTLALLFKQQRLVEGTAVITQAHTLSIGQLDTSLGPDADTQLLPLQQNIYHEYRWIKGALVQTVFPGLYPVTSRSEAEELQDQANKGPLPWDDPLTTAKQMAQDLFHWPDSAVHATLQDKNTTTAHILLVHNKPRLEVIVTLNRLIQHTNGGLWFVTATHTAGITIDQTPVPIPIASPMTVQGTMKHITGHIDIQLFDHTLTTLHKPAQPKHPTPPDFKVQANGRYTATISYNNSMPNQSGLLLIEDTPSEKSKDAGLLLLTSVLLG